jgi:AAA+ superfamily predicted ATPase
MITIRTVLLLFLPFVSYASDRPPVWEECSASTHSLPNIQDIIGDYSRLFTDIAECMENPHDDCEKGYVFYGPPGTGKSTIPLALTKKLDGVCLKISGAIFENKMQGSGPEMIQLLFQRAKEIAYQNEKVIIFIDEIDIIGIRNINPEFNSDANKTLTQLLIEIDNIPKNLPITIIGATNFRQKLDFALTREERLVTVEMSLPNEVERRNILLHYANKYSNLVNCPELMTELTHYAKKTKDFTPATLKKFILSAARGHHEKHFNKAKIEKIFDDIKKRHTENLNNFKNKKEQEEVRLELDKKMLEKMKFDESWKGKAWNFTKFVGSHSISFLVGKHIPIPTPK